MQTELSIYLLDCLNQAVTLLAQATGLSRAEALAIVQERAQLPAKILESPVAKSRNIGKIEDKRP